MLHAARLALLLLSLASCISCQDLFLATSRLNEAESEFQPRVDPAVHVPISAKVEPSGIYTVSVGGQAWYSSSPAPIVCVAGKQVPMKINDTKLARGVDNFGTWAGTTAVYTSQEPSAVMELTFKQYASRPGLLVGTASFPDGLNTSQCGSNEGLSTNFPAFSTSAAKASTLNTLSWRGGVIGTTAAAKGLEKLGANGLDCGPVVSTDSSSETFTTLVWSTLDNHKIVPQQTKDEVYAMGIAAAIPQIPSNYNYSVVFSASAGGATAGMYAWGDLIQEYYNISYAKRLPSVTLTDVGYYTDDGAYYYVWGGGKEKHDPELSNWIPPRPWSAEDGLVLVKEALYAQGVPVAYMQLDDWWYQGPFFFGNVKSVVDWNASNSSGLFPSGLPAFSDKLNLPLQLYTPFWNDKFQTKYRTFESTSFHGTKLVVPDDSYHFFSDMFDLGKSITNGRFSTYEIDFLDSNFKGCAACFDDVGAADRWYKGMADAAHERNITIQYCLPSATDMLASLSYRAVVQARASGDYARPEGNMQPWGNVVTLGGASLLLGATAMAPSKDTLWTASPQPPTSSDRTKSGYHTQPHVELDVILATLSLGPVGISDGLNQTNSALIGQAFRNSKDSTLLRPSRPLSTVDSVFANMSTEAAPSREVWRRLNDADEDFFAPTSHEADLGCAIKEGSAADIRATHASLGKGNGPNSHYVVSWMTTSEVTLQGTDLYPAPATGIKLAMRKHVIKPGGSANGCVNGQPAVPSCIEVYPSGMMPRLPPVATKAKDITAFGYWSIYEPASNGAYFLGELSKIVHVSPQRFSHVHVKGNGPSGLTVGVRGTPGEHLDLVAVDPKGIVHATAITIPASGFTDIML